MTAFEWDVRIDGSNVAGIVLGTGQITFGRTSVFDQPGLPVASLDLLTVDADPRVAAWWPEFTLGTPALPSGFVDVYGDDYAGPASRLSILMPVTVDAVTPSGFVDVYGDEYAGFTSRRLTGTVQAIDYDPDMVRLTLLPPMEAWSRLEVGGTDDTTPIDAESDVDRIERLCTEAGVTITIHGTDGPTVPEIPVNTNPRPLLAQLQEVANAARGLLYSDRDGTVHYRTAANIAATFEEIAATTLPADAMPLGGVALSLDLSQVRTRVIIEYGDPDPGTGLRPSVMVEDADLQDAGYGIREYRGTVALTVEADVEDYAAAVLAQFAPAWEADSATVALSDATDAQVAELLPLQLGAWAHMDTFLGGAPVEDYAAPILGYTEHLSATDWQVTFHLSKSPIVVYPAGG